MANTPRNHEPELESPFRAPQAYEELAGLRWGQSFWNAANATVPFVRVRITPACFEVRVNAWPFFTDHFVFSPSDVSEISIQRGWFSKGIRIKHLRNDYPPFILVWSFCCSQQLAAAKAAGFVVLE